VPRSYTSSLPRMQTSPAAGRTCIQVAYCHPLPRLQAYLLPEDSQVGGGILRVQGAKVCQHHRPITPRQRPSIHLQQGSTKQAAQKPW
jgi:hypothetical protein